MTKTPDILYRSLSLFFQTCTIISLGSHQRIAFCYPRVELLKYRKECITEQWWHGVNYSIFLVSESNISFKKKINLFLFNQQVWKNIFTVLNVKFHTSILGRCKIEQFVSFSQYDDSENVMSSDPQFLGWNKLSACGVTGLFVLDSFRSRCLVSWLSVNVNVNIFILLQLWLMDLVRPQEK